MLYKKRSILISLIAVLILFLTWNSHYSLFSDEITTYTQYEECQNNKCEWANKGTTTWKANYDNQTVILWGDDDKDGELLKLDNCIVKDKYNWNCTHNGDKYIIYKGEEKFDELNFKERAVSKATWWWYHFME